MRPWIAFALLAASAAVGLRHLMGHRHPVLITWLLVPALLIGWSEWRYHSDKQTFSDIASRITVGEVDIECQRLTGAMFDDDDNAGYVKFEEGSPGHTGHLAYETCRDLRAYLHSDKVDSPLQQVVAAQVLAHESFHLVGLTSEARTECAAMQKLDEVAMWLGASEDQAQSLAERYQAEVYPQMPSAYQSSDCVDRGAWDFAPDDTTWP